MLSSDDEALLNDLLDERLSASEEAALSARMEREPALREAWDELVRAREFLRDTPDPVPPSDFTARVRARLAAADAAEVAGDGAARPGEVRVPVGRLESAPAPVIPLFWRRMMTVAYAAAAALILGIGVLALRDREPAARDAATTVASARERERAGEVAGRAKLDADERRAPKPETAVGDDADAEAGAKRSKDGYLGESFGAPLPPSAEGERAEGAVRPLGPGGQVPPGLRQPSDSVPPPRTPEVRKEALPKPVPPPGEPRPALEKGERAADAVRADAPAVELLVLEAGTLETGRALLASVVAGPGARPRGGAAPPTQVALRRLDPVKDVALLSAVRAYDAQAARLGKSRAPAPSAPAAQPSAPAAPASMPPTTPAPSAAPSTAPETAPAPVPTPSSPTTTGLTAPLGGSRPAPVAPLLGVESRTYTREEYARLATFLGPDAAPRGEAKKLEDTRAVRVLIVRPAR